MSELARELFDHLKTLEHIRGLIGKSEDLYLDCKTWPADREAQEMLAKASCGLTNAEGGVLVIGMDARSRAKDEPDLIESAAPVSDTSAVKSRVLDLVGQLVEPRIEGVQATEVNDSTGSKSGFVVVYIPFSEGPPRRSRKDWKFYQRIGSGTFPMEYFQIEERFGRRPPPKLELYLEDQEKRVLPPSNQLIREFTFGLKNAGFAIAKFPSIRYSRASGLLVYPWVSLQLPERGSDSEWVAFRGGVNDVIHPGEVLKIGKIYQQGSNKGPDGLPFPQSFGPAMEPLTKWAFAAVNFQCEISCEGMRTAEVTVSIEAESCLQSKS